MGIHNTVKAANAMTSEACDLSDLSNEDLSNEALSELASELDAKDAVLDKSIDTLRAQAVRVGKDVNRTLSSNDDHCCQCGELTLLMCCDGLLCTHSCYLKCDGRESVPDGPWFCCICRGAVVLHEVDAVVQAKWKNAWPLAKIGMPFIDENGEMETDNGERLLTPPILEGAPGTAKVKGVWMKSGKHSYVPLEHIRLVQRKVSRSPSSSCAIGWLGAVTGGLSFYRNPA